MNIRHFDYALPRERIAQEPLAERDASRLLRLNLETGAIRHHLFRELPELLQPGDLMVVNRSRVFPARLRGRRRTGGGVEILLLRPAEAGAATDAPEWEALVRPGRRLRVGESVDLGGGLQALLLSGSRPPDGRRRVRLLGAGIEELLERVGHTPLPPYIARQDRPADRERYQTVYARERGSVAAPTAGLHFTPALLARLAERGIGYAELVLHVGPGTFKPVEVDEVELHRIDPEPYQLPAETARAIAEVRARGGRVVAVGTTTVRTLETSARDDGTVVAGAGETDLVIVPGFRFRVVDALITNFHLPRSSLLLLVAAFAGRERVLGAYAEAIRQEYRFYSYGDAMLVA